MSILAKVIQIIKRTMRNPAAATPNKKANVERSRPNFKDEPRTILWTLSTGDCRILEVA